MTTTDREGPPPSMVVAVRVRPLSAREQAEGHRPCCEVHGEVVTLSKATHPGQHLKSQQGQVHEFAYDYAFGPEASQARVYQSTAKPLIPYLLEGYNATVFAYGATGAGKTHTMMGSERDGDNSRSKSLEHGSGIIPQSLFEIFNLIEQKRGTDSAKYGLESSSWKVMVSYLEVYNEQIYDLLNPSTRTLQIREDAAQGVVHVAGLAEIEVQNAGEVMDLLRRGNQQRKTEPTAANQVSSRSHAVLQITVKFSSVQAGQRLNKEGKLSLIDLAGSERASKTQNRGIRLHEGANINKSLLALANCINALAANSGLAATPSLSSSSTFSALDSFATPARATRSIRRSIRVQYRDSKLTHLLKTSLEGKCRLVMIANVSAASSSFEESLNTLKYANRAKNIKVVPKATVMTAELSNLQRVTRLEEENAQLREKVASLLASRTPAPSAVQPFLDQGKENAPPSARKKKCLTPEPSKKVPPESEALTGLQLHALSLSSTAKKGSRKRALQPPCETTQEEEEEFLSPKKRARRTPSRNRKRGAPEDETAQETIADLKERLKELQDGRRVMLALIDSLQQKLATAEADKKAAEEKAALVLTRTALSLEGEKEVAKVQKCTLSVTPGSQKHVQTEGEKERVRGRRNSLLPAPTPAYKLRLRARESIGSYLPTPCRDLSRMEETETQSQPGGEGGEIIDTGREEGLRRSRRRASLIPRLPSYSSGKLLTPASKENATALHGSASSRFSSKLSMGVKTRSMTAVLETPEEEEAAPAHPTSQRKILREITNHE